MDNDTIICRCEEVSKSKILSAIEKGASSLDDIKRRTRCGMGLCQGKTCGRLTAQILSAEKGIPVSQIPPSKKRPPVGCISIDILSKEK